MKKRNILLIISSVLLLLALLCFFLNGSSYQGNEIIEKPSLLEMAFGKGDKDLSYGLTISLIALILGFIASILALVFKEKTAYTHFVIAVGLIFGIIVFFSNSLSQPNFADTKIGIAPILVGCFAISSSFTSLISNIIKE